MSIEQILAITFACLFSISEALGAIPAIKSNGIFQVIFGVLAALTGKKKQ